MPLSFSNLDLLLCTLIAFLFGALGSVVFIRKGNLAETWGASLALLGLVSALSLSMLQLVSGKLFVVHIETLLPFFSFSIALDRLSSMFVIMIATIGIMTTIFGREYIRHYAGKYSLGAFYAFYNVFLLAMILVVAADQALFFLFAWEIMTLASYFLVVFEHREGDNVSAGKYYFIFSHIATLFIFCFFFALYALTGTFDFAAWRSVAPLLSTQFLSALSVLALIGFGTKAGILPLHTWLPKAHPAAPSHVSALMSGVMIKTGIYMLIRIFFDLLPNTPSWVGITALLLGAVSAVLGVLYALAERDIKKLLAYSSIENVGIMFIGLGATHIFLSEGEHLLAVFTLAGTLFHVFNHSIFKSLLFMAAGSVVLGTHTRNIERLGGLMVRMPVTGAAFLIGSIAISGIIPFNGFVSEWMIFQSLSGGLLLSPLSKGAMLFAIVMLVLTSALAASCFVRAFGSAFLARSRSSEAERAREHGSGMKFAMVVLSIATILIGVCSPIFASVFADITASLSAFRSFPGELPLSGVLKPSLVNGVFGTLNMGEITIGLLLALLVTLLFTRILGGKRATIIGDTWDCGFPLTPRMELSGTAFSRSIITIFGRVLASETTIERSHYTLVTASLLDIYHRYFYDPIARSVLFIAFWVRKMQSGLTHVYLLYMMIVLIVLMIWTLQ